MFINHAQDRIDFLNKMERRLTCQVNARNQVNQMINEWLPKIKAVLQPWIGQKVSLVTGGKTAKVREQLNQLGLPSERQKQITVSFDNYTAKAFFRVGVSIGDQSKSAEETCYLGDLINGFVLKDLHYEHSTYKTNYDKEDVIKARKALKDAEEAFSSVISSARSALYPFSEHDNF